MGVKHNYSLLENIFCCRCFPCLKADNNSLLTADNRKLVIQKMLAKSQENIEVTLFKPSSTHTTQFSIPCS